MKIAKISLLFLLVPLTLASEGLANITDPFSLTIVPVQPVVTSASEVRIKVTLMNTSDRDITFMSANPECDYSVVVHNAAGNLAPDTEHKRHLVCPQVITGRNILVHLKPNESHEDEIVVSKLSDMRAPGKYFVQVTRKVPKLSGNTIKSGIATVTVSQLAGCPVLARF